VDRRDPASAGINAELPARRGDVALNAEALGELALLDKVAALRKRFASLSTNASKPRPLRSHSSNPNEAKTFSRCWSRLTGRTMVVVGNWNDLDPSLSLRFRVGGDKIAQRPHI
jgi:hypothetical protein